MPEKPDPSPYHRIRSLRVKGGFLDGLHIEFGQNLNCLIGGRGTGKTTVLELMRWVLDQMPDQKESPDLFRDVDKLIRANLAAGQVDMEIETLDGIRYRVQRGYGDGALVLDEHGEPVEIEIRRGNIFSAEIYSQNQIEAIANDPLFQLKLLDKFVANKVKEADAQIQSCERDLRVNAGEILKLRKDIVELKEQISQLPEVVEKLKAFKIEGGDEEAKALQKESTAKAVRDQEKRSLERLQELLSSTGDRLRNVVADLPGQVAEYFTEAILDGPNGPLLRQIKALVDGDVRDVGRKVEEAARLAESTRDKLHEKSEEVATLHLKQEKAYQDLLEKREKEKDKAKERDQLLRRQAELQEGQKKLDRRREDLQKKVTARAALLRRLSDMKDGRYRLRADVAEMLTSKLAPTIGCGSSSTATSTYIGTS